MAFMLGRHGVFLELNEDVEDYEDLTEIMSNVQLNSNFLALAREVEDAGLHSNSFWFGGSGSQVDSARMNLASSFVNGFVNAAFGQDKLLTDDGNKWLYKNKDHGRGTPTNHAYIFLIFVVVILIIFQVVGVTALACGMIAVGSCNGDVTSTIVQTIMEKNEQELKDTYARWLPLGLGLNHLGMLAHRKGEAIETTLAALQVVPEPFRSFANTLVDICAYAAVPLALALISVSNPRLNILDTLSKFSHDADPEVSHNSIFAMGMVGSGKC
ncbi:hypothetical protein GOODEAATRI_013203 [Goodea atripinnis]|uniref:RPN1 N-terminal domain-containing protein n=1 Tax=Goodea atripinnis TaxID=208336 RepID=A0ABV0PDP5_9TELE